jgi:hypothetical protein
VKHAVQRGICVPTQHLLWDQVKPRKTFPWYAPTSPPPVEIDAEVKRTGKRTWRPGRVVLVVEAGGGISEGAVAGFAVVAGLKIVCPQSSSLNV